MSLSSVINFDNPLNFTFDSTKIEFTESVAQLKLISDPGNAFNEPFDSDVGFTYDSALAEFVAGKVQQKDQRPANATFGATFANSINGNWGGGVLTGTSVGGAAILGGKLDLTGGTLKYVSFSATGNAQSQQTGCVRLRYTPNYTGAPAVDRAIFGISASQTSQANIIQIIHLSTGNIVVYIYNSAGAAIIAGVLVGAFSPTINVTYEFELNWDLTSGATRVFINGVQLGATMTQTGTRSSVIANLIIGSNWNGVAAPDFKIDSVGIFSTVQHTANYTPGYTLSEMIYAASKVELPQFAYPGTGAIQGFSSLATIETTTPRYILNDLWWSGVAWAASSGAYAQANTQATILANIATLPASKTLDIDVVFTASSMQSSVDDLTTTYTSQTYPTDDPDITQNAGLNLDGLLTFTSVLAEAGLDGVKFHVGIDGIPKYWDGAAWSTSDETYAQSNTATEINTNAATLDIALGVVLKLHAVLHSNDGSTTPTITSATIGYDAYFPPSAEPATCTVYGHVRDILGNKIFTAASVKVAIAARIIFPSGHIILPITKTASIGANGYFEIDLVQTFATGDKMRFLAEYDSVSTFLGEAVIPAQPSVELGDILNI